MHTQTERKVHPRDLLVGCIVFLGPFTTNWCINSLDSFENPSPIPKPHNHHHFSHSDTHKRLHIKNFNLLTLVLANTTCSPPMQVRKSELQFGEPYVDLVPS